MPLHSFEGFIESIERRSRGITVRLLEGGFDPSPTTPPAWLVTVEEPADFDAVVSKLSRMKESDEGVYAWIASQNQVGFQSDHGDELTINAKHVSAVRGGFEHRDYERLAKFNHDWGQSQHLALLNQTARLDRVRDLLRNQQDRLARKAEGHAVGSTARTLYDQQLAFLARLLAETEA